MVEIVGADVGSGRAVEAIHSRLLHSVRVSVAEHLAHHCCDIEFTDGGGSGC